MSADQREQILTCARDIYVEEGLQGLSMRHLARCVGVTAPAIYRHFDSKEALVSEVVREGLEVFGTYMYRALEGETPEERLRAAGEAYLDFALEQRRYYELLFMSSGQIGLEGLSEETRNLAAASFQFLVDRVRECMDEGVLEEDDPCAVATTLWGHGHGLVSLFLSGSLDVEEEGFRELFRGSRSRVLAGLARRRDGDGPQPTRVDRGARADDETVGKTDAATT